MRNSSGFVGRKHKRRRKGNQSPRAKNSGIHPTPVTPTQLLAVKKNISSGFNLQSERMLIALFWDIALKCPPPDDWDGEFGSITVIMRSLRLKGKKEEKLKGFLRRHMPITCWRRSTMDQYDTMVTEPLRLLSVALKTAFLRTVVEQCRCVGCHQ